MPHGTQQLARRGVVGQLAKHAVIGFRAVDQVVAVIAVAQHGIETRQVRGVALDDPAALAQGRP